MAEQFEGDHILSGSIEIDPSFYVALLTKKDQKMMVEKINKGESFPIVLDFSNFKVYIGKSHIDIKKEFGIQNSDSVAMYANKNPNTGEFIVSDFIDLKEGKITNKTAAKKI